MVDCSASELTTAEYLQCAADIVYPTVSVLMPILGVAVLVNVLFAGIYVARRSVRAFVSDTNL